MVEALHGFWKTNFIVKKQTALNFFCEQISPETSTRQMWFFFLAGANVSQKGQSLNGPGWIMWSKPKGAESTIGWVKYHRSGEKSLQLAEAISSNDFSTLRTTSSHGRRETTSGTTAASLHMQSVCEVSQDRRQWSSSFKAVEISLAYWTKILTLLFGLSLIRSASRMASGSRTMMVTPAISSNDRCGWRSWTGFSGFQRRQEIASSLQTDVIGSRSTAIWEQQRVTFREGGCWTSGWGHPFQTIQSMPSDMPPM